MHNKKYLSLRAFNTLVVCATSFISMMAMAQVTPTDVRDLIGVKAPGGESELASRGYVIVEGRQGRASKFVYWWNDRRGVCLAVETKEGRYDSLVATTAADCGQGSHANSDRYQPAEFGYNPPRGNYQEHIALICYGEGDRPASKMKSGYEWDDQKKKYVPKTGFELSHEEFSTSVTIEIDGDRGRVRPAKNMLPLLHSSGSDGWYDIQNLSISRDMIRGEFKLNSANRPKISIDRRAGHVSFDGLTKFNGNCTPLDSDRRF